MIIKCPFCDLQVPNKGTWEDHYIDDHGKNMSKWDIAAEMGILLQEKYEPKSSTKGLFLK